MRPAPALLALLAACRPQTAGPARPEVVAYPAGPTESRAHAMGEEIALAVFSNVYQTLVQLGPDLICAPGWPRPGTRPTTAPGSLVLRTAQPYGPLPSIASWVPGGDTVLEAVPEHERTVASRGLRVVLLGMDGGGKRPTDVSRHARPFRDVRVRRAAAPAIDREALVRGPLGGFADVIDQIVTQARGLLRAGGFEVQDPVFDPRLDRRLDAAALRWASPP